MTPTTPLAGLFVGLLDGLVITAIVLLAVLLDGRRRRRRHPEMVPVEAGPTGDGAPEGPDRVPHAA